MSITLITSLAVAVLPSISGLVAVRNREGLEEKINYSFRLCFLIAIRAAVGLISLSKSIYSLFKYDVNSAVLMQYGAVILILMAVVQIQTSIIQGIGKIYLVTLYAILGLAGKIVIMHVEK